MLRILVIADDILARTGLVALLESATDCEVVGQVSAGPSLADDVNVYGPDVLLADLGWAPETMLGPLSALSALAELQTPLVALLADESAAAAVLRTLAAFDVYGLLLRDSGPEILFSAMQAAAAGLVSLDPSLVADLLQPATPDADTGMEPLTSRENEVLQGLAQGLTNKAIALQLGITDHTVKFHVNAIMGKLGAQSRTEAVVLATRVGLIVL